MSDDAPLARANDAEDRRRFPGVKSFEETDAGRFFGREQVSEELLLRVLSVRLLLQFAPSGVGKTSVLQAGLFPLLRRRGYFPVMVRLNRADEPLIEAMRRSLSEAAVAFSLVDPVIPAAARDASDLLAGTQLWTDELSILTPVLVFDQFEEVFTLRDEAFRAGLARDIGALVDIRSQRRDPGAVLPVVKIILSLREEFLGRLDNFTADIPELFQERLRLAPLTNDEARLAMVTPADLDGERWDSPRFRFERLCLDDLLGFIDGVSDRHPVIEPLTLQLVCRHAEDLAKAAKERGDPALTLHLADFGGPDGLKRLVSNHFALQLGRLPERTRRRARALFEQGLLDPNGKRLMLEQGEIERDHGIALDTLDALVESGLLRREPRNESFFYEISHDRLAEAIGAQRKALLPRWVVPTLAGSVAAAVLLAGFAAIVFNQRAQTQLALDSAEAAQARAEGAYSLLLGETIVPRLVDSGAADALASVLDRIDSGRGEDPGVQPAVLKLRHQGDLLLDRGTLGQARAKFQEALRTLEQPAAAGKAEPREALAERARLQKRLGDIELDSGRAQQADRHYDTAAENWARLLSGKPSPTQLLDAAELHIRLARTAPEFSPQADMHIAAAIGAAIRAWMIVNTGPSGDRSGNLGFEQGRAVQVLADAVLVKANFSGDGVAYSGATALALEARRMRPFSSQAVQQVATAQARFGVPGEPLSEQLRDSERQLNMLMRFDPDHLRMRREHAAVMLVKADSIVGCAETAKCRRTQQASTLRETALNVIEATGDLRWLADRDAENRALQGDLAWALSLQARLQAATPGGAMASIALFDQATDAYRASGGANEGTGNQVEQENIRAMSKNLMARSKALARAARADDALASAAAAFKLLEPFPPDVISVRLTRWELLNEQVAMLSALGRTAQARTAEAAKEELLKGIGEPWDAHKERALAAAKAGLDLLKQADGLSGADALKVNRDAIERFLEAVKEHPVEPAYWETLRFLFDKVANGGGFEPATGLAAEWTRSEAAARAAAISAARMAHVLSTDAATLKSQSQLYETRRSLALLHYKQQRYGPAFTLAQDNLFESREMHAAADRSGQALEQMRDAFYGVGLTRFESGAAGWEESIRVALEYGRQVRDLRANSAEDTLWIGKVYADLGKKLKLQATASGAADQDFRQAVAECRRGARLLKKASAPQELKDCLDDVPAELR